VFESSIQFRLAATAASCFALPAASSSPQALAGAEEEQVSLPSEERGAPAAARSPVVSALAQAGVLQADDRCAEALPDVPPGDCWAVQPVVGWLAASAPHDSVVPLVGGWLEPSAQDGCWVALLAAGWRAGSVPYDSVVQPADDWLEPSAQGGCWVALRAAGWPAVSAPSDSVVPRAVGWLEPSALDGCWVVLPAVGWPAASAPHDSVVPRADDWLEPSALDGYSAVAEPVGSLLPDARWV
jgi:hypothetical protein